MYNVGGFMGHERHVVRLLPRPEPDMVAMGEGAGLERGRGFVCVCIVVHPHVLEIVAKHRLDVVSYVRRQGRATIR